MSMWMILGGNIFRLVSTMKELICTLLATALIMGATGLPISVPAAALDDISEHVINISYYQVCSWIEGQQPRSVESISSISDLDRFISSSSASEAVDNLREKYNERYFNDSFIIIAVLREESSSNHIQVTSFEEHDSGHLIEIGIDRIVPKDADGDVTVWYIIIEVERVPAVPPGQALANKSIELRINNIIHAVDELSHLARILCYVDLYYGTYAPYASLFSRNDGLAGYLSDYVMICSEAELLNSMLLSAQSNASSTPYPELLPVYDGTFFDDKFLIFIKWHQSNYSPMSYHISSISDDSSYTDVVITAEEIATYDIEGPTIGRHWLVILEMDKTLLGRGISITMRAVTPITLSREELIMQHLPSYPRTSPGIEIDGIPVTFPDQQPAMQHGKTLVPVRIVFDAMGFAVNWNPEMRQTILSNREHTVVITENSTAFTANGVSHEFDIPVQIMNGRTMAPVRAVLESIGYTVGWDNERNAVIVTMPQGD